MGFADRYLSGYSNSYSTFAPDLGPMKMIVVIPCFNEPCLIRTLRSLVECAPPSYSPVGVVVVVNSSERSSFEIKEQNKRTLHELDGFMGDIPAWLSLFVVHAENLPSKWAGVGWARKIGMDWAVSHFNRTDNRDGIIVSFDADSLVAPTYFQSLEKHFADRVTSVAATIGFEHPLENEAIILYELYLRYFRNALKWIGAPYDIHTIGSSFAVKAAPYTAVGGMNRRQAGEDFYFLHKVAQYGEVSSIQETLVFPSARVSDRVPFGTGAALRRWGNGDRGIEMTYSLTAFGELEKLFERTDSIYESRGEIDAEGFHPDLLLFLDGSKFNEECLSLARNCSSVAIFKKRFFHLFNAFKVLKWLHFAIEKGWEKKPLVQESAELLRLLNVEIEENNSGAEYLLHLFREQDKRCLNLLF